MWALCIESPHSLIVYIFSYSDVHKQQGTCY